MGNITVSAAGAEIVSIYINAQYAPPLITGLINMGHPQLHNKLQIDTTTAEAFSKDPPQEKKSKYIGMCFYWLQYYDTQGQFNIFWRQGKYNLGDYQTKNHYLKHPHLMWYKCIHTE